MRYLLPLLILLASCGSAKRAQWHYKRALHNGLQVVQQTDTITINTLDSFPVIIHDSIVWQKFITTKDTIIEYSNIYVPKTRWQTRIEYKERVKTLRIQGKTITKDHEIIKNKILWWPILLAFILGFFLRFFIQKGLIDRIVLLYKSI